MAELPQVTFPLQAAGPPTHAVHYAVHSKLSNAQKEAVFARAEQGEKKIETKAAQNVLRAALRCRQLRL